MLRSVGDKIKELRWLSIFFLFAALLLVGRLFVLQILEHDYYATMAMSTHEIYQKLHPTRGQIFFQDSRNDQVYPVAVNRRYYKVFAVPQEIKLENVASTTQILMDILQLPPEKNEELIKKLSKHNDPYELVAKKIMEETVNQIKSANLKGIYFAPEVYRFYPENNWGAAVLGFCSLDQEENMEGRYGVEGYWDKILAGRSGFLFGERAARGGWISLAGMTSMEAENGADLVLTIDRVLQYQACSRLKRGLDEYGARSASLVMLNPKTGAVLAMCSMPDYDPNNYSKVDNLGVYNNSAIFIPYEPGSVFKPIVMSVALDLNLVNPNTVFNDPCTRQFGKYTIHNAGDKCYGNNVTMTKVLENSINTGMIWVQEKIKRDILKDYVEKFGFGQKIGLPLDMEMPGNISLLNKKSPIYGAQASFGQGLTVTPLQLAQAYSAFVNQGKIYQPQLVKEIQYTDGRREKFEPKLIGQIIAPRAAKLMKAMLISVVEKTYWRTVKMDKYYIAGKTGTAQIPGRGGYSEETNHTFAGFAPATDPKFVIVVKFEAPELQWAESTATIIFKDLTKFALDYYGIKGDRQ